MIPGAVLGFPSDELNPELPALIAMPTLLSLFTSPFEVAAIIVVPVKFIWPLSAQIARSLCYPSWAMLVLI